MSYSKVSEFEGWAESAPDRVIDFPVQETSATHGRKEGRNRISSSFMRPSVDRWPLYLPSLRFRALVRRLPPVSFFAPTYSRSSLSPPSSVRPFVVPITAAAAAPALPSRHALCTLNYGQTTQHASSVWPPPARPAAAVAAAGCWLNIEWFSFNV